MSPPPVDYPHGVLVFARADEPAQGFVTNDADRDGTSDETVIRELVQNALDASGNGPNGDGQVQGQGQVQIRLHDVKMPTKSLPHLDRYQTAFRQAERLLASEEPATGKQAIARIKRALNQDKTRCLICVDHGAGINQKALQALYSKGRSTKLSRGRGSVGAGHLTAFAPSDLRYVLYAGRASDGSCTFGGHAILGSHSDAGDKDVRRSNHGFIKEDEMDRLFERDTGGRSIPPALDKYVPKDGGSAVMIAAYAPLAPGNDDLPGLALGAVAKDFLVQVHRGGLVAEVHNDQNLVARLDRQTLQSVIGAIRGKRNKDAAQRMLRTLTEGETLPADGLPGATIWFRKRLEQTETQHSRVWIFRDGMFIEHNTVPYVGAAQLSGVAPFDAVIDASSSDDFGQLIREAEGVSHTRIRPSEIDDKAARTRLKDMLHKLADLLKEQADDLDDGSAYEPAELKLEILNERLYRSRQKPKQLPGTTEDEVGPQGPALGEKRAQRKGGGKGGEGAQQTSAGNTTGVSLSCRADPNTASEFRVSWRAKQPFRQGAEITLRMYLPSGTDQTSEKPIKPRYYKIQSVQVKASGQFVSHKFAHGVNDGAVLSGLPQEGEALVRIEDGSFGSAKDFDRGLVTADLLRRHPKASAAADTPTVDGKAQEPDT